jgi:predicted kinase
MIATRAPVRHEDVARILAEVRAYASRRQRPRPTGWRAALAVLVGLPASGKSRVAEELRRRTGALVLESDALRRLLFPRRSYSAAESRRLFAAIHGAIDELLAEGASVVLDATNLTEAERAPLYQIAERCAAKLILVQVTAPRSLARRRMARREATGVGRSEADLQVYERMRSQLEEVQRQHHVVDTSQDIEPALAAIAKEMTGP